MHRVVVYMCSIFIFIHAHVNTGYNCGVWVCMCVCFIKSTKCLFTHVSVICVTMVTFLPSCTVIVLATTELVICLNALGQTQSLSCNLSGNFFLNSPIFSFTCRFVCINNLVVQCILYSHINAYYICVAHSRTCTNLHICSCIWVSGQNIVEVVLFNADDHVNIHWHDLKMYIVHAALV